MGKNGLAAALTVLGLANVEIRRTQIMLTRGLTASKPARVKMAHGCLSVIYGVRPFVC